jgi:hypothetical protein
MAPLEPEVFGVGAAGFATVNGGRAGRTAGTRSDANPRDGDTIMPAPGGADAPAATPVTCSPQQRPRDDHLVGPPRRKAHAVRAVDRANAGA